MTKVVDHFKRDDGCCNDSCVLVFFDLHRFSFILLNELCELEKQERTDHTSELECLANEKLNEHAPLEDLEEGP